MAGVAFAVEGDGVGFATESYAASALYATLARLSDALWRIRRAKPSLWIAEPLSPLEDALREDDASLRDDEHTDDVRSLLEENTRLRGRVVKYGSQFVGYGPAPSATTPCNRAIKESKFASDHDVPRALEICDFQQTKGMIQ